jgi:hypothetical protein
MKTLEKYAAAFGVGSFVGIANELLVNPDHWCLTNPNIKAITTFSVFNIYGWSAVICTAIFDLYSKRKVDGMVLIILATLAVAAFEGIAGQISKRYHNGVQTWKYPDCWIPFYDGYVSVVSTLYFGVGITLFYYLFYKPLLAGN